jgi:phosphoserine phosphatase
VSTFPVTGGSARDDHLEQSQAIVNNGRSDIPLFGQVGFAVALNATPQAKAAASLSVDTNWLPEILQVVPDL